ncbi:unnamed protein product [Didymodactylos carnosus]|uniref:3-oxoacyl-[acyl-carrier-protein] reductase n=1 Tax=Didymodactylos carnosus TaxID=1234261 RepID=A0A813ZX76_9BILA|nr:unnamed protein product [Didymodactylos carnosus]CAF1273349.1 unnamed protein product [Didymodactylos carnosus]CAF3688165.1 unnamed protein product [Didymodactylos carnosus]CAF4078629.1 unnamed protein product [Didymodactylos carnosus]
MTAKSITRTVLITGSTSGIGLGIANVFAKNKYNIIFNGLEAEGSAIASSIAKENSIDYLYSPANAMRSAELKTMVDEGLAKFGHIDILVNNAGVQHVAPIEDFPENKWAQILQINLTASYLLTKYLWKQMKQQKFGRIINIASAHGLFASEYKSAYVAAKHGLIGFTKVAALEGAAFNINCNAICPGYVRTPLVELQIRDQAKSHGIPEGEVITRVMLQKQAVKEFVPVELVGNLALFLAGEKAGTLTGTAIPVDGGWSAQ